MEFLEKDCADAINEIYRLNNLVESNDKYYEDEVESLRSEIEGLQDEIADLEDQY